MPATVGSRSSRSVDEPLEAPPRSDAYVGILIISLLAQIVGAVFLYLDYNSYPDKKPPQPAKTAPAFQPGGGSQPPPAGAAGNPAPAGMMGGNPAPAGMGGNPNG